MDCRVGGEGRGWRLRWTSNRKPRDEGQGHGYQAGSGEEQGPGVEGNMSNQIFMFV